MIKFSINLFQSLVVLVSDGTLWGSAQPYLLFLLLLLCLSAIWFYCYAVYGAIALFSRPTIVKPEFHPPISILKPICGLDKDAYENFASFCHQDYPSYQIIFAVRDPQDPVVEIVQKVIFHFPNIDIQLVVSDRTIGTNLKVSNLANAAAKAKHAILLFADSDIRVGSNYLKQTIQPLIHPRVGVVTCLYRSQSQGWVADLEALGTATEFHPSVFVGNQLEGLKFAMGSTIVIRRSVLEAIGGFEAIGDYLEDDFQVGHLSAQAGYEVVLSTYVVEHVLATNSVVDSWHRQIRWTRGSRVSKPWGHVGLIFTYGTVTSLLFLLLTKGAILGWVVLGITWAIRLGMAWFIGVESLNDPATKKLLWLVPLRDFISFALWCYSFVGNTVEWRGQRFSLNRGGELIAFVPKSVRSVGLH